jgi:hypothetical protein
VPRAEQPAAEDKVSARESPSIATPFNLNRPGRRSRKWSPWVIGGVGIVILLGLLHDPAPQAPSSSSSSAPSASTPRACHGGGVEVTSDSEPGDLMASIEEQSLCPGEVSRARFRTLLTRLGPGCRESERRISDMIVHTQRILKDKGLSVRLVEITEELDRSVGVLRGQSDDQICAKLLVVYSISRESQGVTGR